MTLFRKWLVLGTTILVMLAILLSGITIAYSNVLNLTSEKLLQITNELKDSTTPECIECIELLTECADQLKANNELIEELRNENEELKMIINAFEPQIKIDRNRFVYIGAGYPLSIGMGFSFFPRRLEMLGLNAMMNMRINTETNTLQPGFMLGGGIRF